MTKTISCTQTTSESIESFRSGPLTVDNVERDDENYVTIYSTDKNDLTTHFTLSQELIDQLKSI